MPKPGDILEQKYRVEKVLGEGGMGVVLAAHHQLLDQRVAVKVLFPETARDEEALQRFLLEARSTARINSEHVARVMDVGTLPGGSPFIVMEYLEGCDLDELLKLNGPLPTTEMVDYVLQALEGIAQAHALGIVHRDLKPANLFLATMPNGSAVIKILDFGISKSIASRSSGKTGVLTREHTSLGSPAYMSPEQVRNAKNVDPRTDIWSIGIVMYELLDGRVPFGGNALGEIFSNILETEAAPLTRRRADVPPELSDVVACCMQRDREHRFSNVSQLARALAPFGTPSSAHVMVERIDQTLRRTTMRSATPLAMQVRPRLASTPDAMTMAGNDESAGSRERASDPESASILVELPPPASSPRPVVGMVTAGVAFSTDSHEDTQITVRTKGRKRKTLLFTIGAVAAMAAAAVVAIGLRATTSSAAPAAAAASALGAPEPKTPPGGASNVAPSAAGNAIAGATTTAPDNVAPSASASAAAPPPVAPTSLPRAAARTSPSPAPSPKPAKKQDAKSILASPD